MLQGQALMSVDLSGSASLSEVRRRLLAFLDKSPEITPESGIWLKGMGWDQNLWSPAEFPNVTDLDIEPRLRSIPISLARIDAHATWVNGRALDAVRPLIKNASSEKGGGKVIRDAQGNPTGIFMDDAMFLVEKAMPALTEAERLKALDLVVKEMVSNGLTGLHDAGVLPSDIAFFKRYVKYFNFLIMCNRAIDAGTFPIRNCTD